MTVTSYLYTKKKDSDMSERFINQPMTKQQIVEKVRKMETKNDLLKLLNTIKKEDLGENYHPFKISLLNYYCNPNRDPQKRYKHFTIPKKSGGVRDISAPVKGLKSMLTYVNVVFQALYEPSDAAMGFVPGRSIVDNARVHVRKNYVFNTDLKDFFPSVHQARIWKVLQMKPFSFNKELASVIAGLCCMRDNAGNGVLPQGSPCSPILTNIVCRQLDRRLSGLARRFNISYTRYADDITFSSDYNVFQEDSEFMTEFRRIIADQHFAINAKKTRLQKKNQRQEVTGLVVNEKVNIVREYVRDIRNLLYIWERYGYEQAYSKFFSRYINIKAYRPRKKGMPQMEAVIAGKLLYIRMVIGSDSTTYSRLAERFGALSPKGKEVLETNLTYDVSYKLNEFEQLFNTCVEFKYKSNTNSIGKSKTTASCIIDDNVQLVAVNIRCDSTIDKYLAEPKDETLANIKKRFYISLCRRGNHQFWLITVGKMDNEHKGAYKDEYKIKANPEMEESYQDTTTPDKSVSDYVDDIIETIDEFNHDDQVLGDIDSYETSQDEATMNEMLSLDAALAAFVSSEFDFKTLEKWDKTKKS